MKPRRSPSTQQVRNYMEDIFSKEELDLLTQKEDVLEKMAPEIDKIARNKKEAVASRAAATKIAQMKDLNVDERLALEAIIIPQGRPVIDIKFDSYDTPKGKWSHLGKKEIRNRIEACIPLVGRVELPEDQNLDYIGTGFIVASDLLMTNRHVAAYFCSGLGIRGLRFRPGQSAGIDFREEIVDSENIYLGISKVVMIHPYWDMALLQVVGIPQNQSPLVLSTEHPEDLKDHEIAVIGYPAFDTRNDPEVQNRIFRGQYDVKRLQPGTLTGRRVVKSFENLVNAMKHNASTLGGNSGSAVLDITTGRVVGLHFAGKYMDSNYAVPTFDLARDPHVQAKELNFVGSVPNGQVKWMPRWLAADPVDEVQDRPNGNGGRNSSTPRTTSVDNAGHEATWTIPLSITIDVGQPTRGATPAIPGPGVPAVSLVEKPNTTPDPNYQNRTGYDPDFLPDGHAILIPWLSDAQYAITARNNTATSQRHVLPYNHFSIVMNRERRIAFFTAVNIDGTQEDEVIRDDFNDDWSLDPRADEAAQMDNEYYRDAHDIENPLDRGHLVRRLDPCWGSTRDEVIAAHHDTFHYTNCSPQHKGFNRYQTYWGGMEDYILDNANSKNLRVTVFTGPVFRDDDPVYMTPTGHQLQLPLEYWKVVAMVKADGQLSATGYLLSQSTHVNTMLEEFAFGAYREFQTRISEIESLTDLDFRGLAAHDAFSGTQEAVANKRKEIRSYGDIVL